MPCIQQKSCAKSELIPWNSQLEIVSCVVTMMTSVSSPDGVSEVLGGDPHRGAGHAEQRGGPVVELQAGSTLARKSNDYGTNNIGLWI